MGVRGLTARGKVGSERLEFEKGKKKSS